MPSKLTTRITWLSDEELEEARKKAKQHKNFSAFMRDAARDYKPQK